MITAKQAGALLLAICFAAASAAQDQEQPKRVPPRLGERIINPPIADEYESAAARLLGTTLSPAAKVKACAHLYPEFTKENSAALEAWEKRHAKAIALIRDSAREVLVKYSGGNLSLVERTLRKHEIDAQGGTLDALERAEPAVARTACQTLPDALTRGAYVLESTPEFAILRSHGEDSTN